MIVTKYYFRNNLFNLSTKDNYVYVNNGNKESIGETIQDSIDYFLNEINSEQNDNDGEEDSFNPSHDFTPAFYHQSVKGSLISEVIFKLFPWFFCFGFSCQRG